MADETIGPIGGEGGEAWDDKTHNTIRQINVFTGEVVDSIQVVYDNGGRMVCGPKHGGDGGQLSTVQFDYPTEYLVSISGHFGPYIGGHVVMHSLTFHSNKQQYGPYGTEDGTLFSGPTANGRIVGLFGKSATYLNSIGAHFEFNEHPPSNLLIINN